MTTNDLPSCVEPYLQSFEQSFVANNYTPWTPRNYRSMSLPYHIGNGWFGGMLPLLATAVVKATGNIYNGLWYPIGVALMTVVIGFFFLRDTKDVDIVSGSGVAEQSNA